MSNIARWIAGTLAPNWTAAFGTEINSLAAADVAVSSIVIDNATALDELFEISFSLTGTTPTTGVSYLTFYLLALNQDGTTYGDGTVSGAVLPGSNYQIASVQVPLGKTSAVLTGHTDKLDLPRGSFVLAVANNTGNALAASGNTISYRTTNENLNG